MDLGVLSLTAQLIKCSKTIHSLTVCQKKKRAIKTKVIKSRKICILFGSKTKVKTIIFAKCESKTEQTCSFNMAIS